MVKTLNITLDDADHAKAKRVKDELNVTWAEFVVVAATELADDNLAGQEVQGSISTSLSEDRPGERVGAGSGDHEDTDPIADALAGWSHGQNAEQKEASDVTARASLEWLRNHGEKVQKSDVPLDEMQDSDPLGRQTNTLWKKVIKPAWDHAAEGEYVEKPHSRGYRWSGDE